MIIENFKWFMLLKSIFCSAVVFDYKIYKLLIKYNIR